MMRGNLQALLLGVATLSCVAGGGGGTEPSPLAIDQGAMGSTVKVRVGQSLVLSLPGNPSTGYTWEQLPGCEPMLSRMGEPLYTPAGNLVGAGGSFRFTFLACQKGQTPLRLVYRRSFEEQTPPAERFEVTVVVE